MLTLFSTLISILAGGLPKILDMFQDHGDKKHEIAMAQLQMQQQLELAAKGFASQERIEDIHTEQLQIQTASDDRKALYQHDIDTGKGASQWVINARAMVRPAVAYGLLSLLIFVDIAGFLYAWQHGVDFTVMLDGLWDQDTQLIWASVIGFYFGNQAFAAKK